MPAEIRFFCYDDGKTCAECKNYWEGRDRFELKTKWTIVWKGEDKVRNNKCFKGVQGMDNDTPACEQFEQLDFDTMSNRKIARELEIMRTKIHSAIHDLKHNNSRAKFSELIEYLDSWLDDTGNVTGVDNGK